MIRLDKEFRQWLDENAHFYEHLRMHDSILYNRFLPVYEVLRYLYEEELQNYESADEDVLKIFQVGFEYLHSQVNICKIYLEKVFNNDIHELLEYEQIINYVLYIEDLQYELNENNIEVDDNKLNQLTHYLESIIMKKKLVPENIKMYVDSKVHEIIGNDDHNFNSIIDIFVEIADALEIELYNEEDYTIGKEI